MRIYDLYLSYCSVPTNYNIVLQLYNDIIQTNANAEYFYLYKKTLWKCNAVHTDIIQNNIDISACIQLKINNISRNVQCMLRSFFYINLKFILYYQVGGNAPRVGVRNLQYRRLPMCNLQFIIFSKNTVGEVLNTYISIQKSFT